MLAGAGKGLRHLKGEDATGEKEGGTESREGYQRKETETCSFVASSLRPLRNISDHERKHQCFFPRPKQFGRYLLKPVSMPWLRILIILTTEFYMGSLEFPRFLGWKPRQLNQLQCQHIT